MASSPLLNMWRVTGLSSGTMVIRSCPMGCTFLWDRFGVSGDVLSFSSPVSRWNTCEETVSSYLITENPVVLTSLCWLTDHTPCDKDKTKQEGDEWLNCLHTTNQTGTTGSVVAQAECPRHHYQQGAPVLTWVLQCPAWPPPVSYT